MATSTLYLEVTAAAAETARKILARRQGQNRKPLQVTVDARGGMSASVHLDPRGNVVMSLPSLPASTVLSRLEADRMLGFVAHECLHVLHTDWQWWSHCVQAGARTRHWANCLEDVRIEAKEIRAGHFPALRGILSATMDHLHYQGLTGAAKAGRVIGARIADAPYCVAVLGRLANKYTVPTARGLRAALHPDVARLVDMALSEVKACRSTQDVYRLARRMVAMEELIIAANQPAAPPPPPPRDDQDAPDTDQDDQDAPGASGDDQDTPDTDQDAPDTDQDAPGASGDDQNAPDTDQDAPDTDQDAPGASGDEDAPGEVGDEDAPGDGHGDGSDTYSVDDAPDASETLTEVTEAIKERQTADAPRGPMAPGGLHGYRNTTMAMPRVIAGDPLRQVTAFNAALLGRAVLHGQISRLLVSPERVSVTHRETSGRLDRRALARIGTGALDVFSRREETAGMDTALVVLIDLSSSMYGPAHAMACVTAYHLASAAEDAGAKVGVYGFVNLPYGTAKDVAGAQLVPLIEVGMPVRANAHRIMSVQPHITTPMSPAILGCAELLRTIDANRHILMVLTDGDCDYGAGCVTDACLVARSWGVEVVALGMAAPQVVNAFPDGHSINVASLTDLGRVGLGVLARMLEETMPEFAA